MVKTPLRIGVLALQGGFREHVAMVRRCGAEAVEIRRHPRRPGADWTNWTA